MREIWIQTQREDGYVKMETEIGVMMPQAKAWLGLPEAEREKEESSPTDTKESIALLTP